MLQKKHKTKKECNKFLKQFQNCPLKKIFKWELFEDKISHAGSYHFSKVSKSEKKFGPNAHYLWYLNIFRISPPSFTDEDNKLHRQILREEAQGSTYFFTSLGQFLEERQGLLK